MMLKNITILKYPFYSNVPKNDIHGHTASWIANIALGHDCLALQAAMSVMAQPTKRQSFSVSALYRGYRYEY